MVTSEPVKRLPPTQETIKKLFALSGNQCAFPNCIKVIISSKGNVVGQVCHISAADEGGPRFDPAQSNEQRRAFDNLLLMCSLCRARHNEHYAAYRIMPRSMARSTTMSLSYAA
jgi:hypothetical protein